MATKIKISQLPENNLFCPLPWIGAHVMPNGVFSYCCVQNQFDDDLIQAGNLKEQTINEARNNEWSNQLRKNLINGVQHQSCRDCWNLENQGIPSLRQHYHNQWFKNAGYEKDFEINVDGTLDDQSIIYWDVRQTNLCNMNCVMCGSDYSSVWNRDVLKSQDKIVTNAGVVDAVEISKDDIFDIIKKDIDKTYKFYFAGGEPLISPMHWKILEELIEQELFNVEIAYNTNLLKLDYKGKNIIDYWKKFKTVYVGCSIDAVGARAEIVRSGTVWETVHKNFCRLNDELFYSKALNITSTNMSIGGLAETIAWAKSFEWDREENTLLANNIVYYPNYLSINVLPEYLKESIWKDIKDPLRTLKDKRSLEQIENQLWKKINKDEFEMLSISFAHHLQWISGMRQIDPVDMLKHGCPELTNWFEDIVSKYHTELQTWKN